MKTKALNFLMMIFFLTAGFFLTSVILMGTWNYTIPRLITSVEGSNTYRDIDYQTSMVFTVLLALIFGGGGALLHVPWPVYSLMGKKAGHTTHNPHNEKDNKQLNASYITRNENDLFY